MAKYIFMFFVFALLIIVMLAVIFFVIGRVIAINNLHLLVAGIASISTAALFVKQQKREPSNNEKLLFTLIITIVLLIISVIVTFFVFTKLGKTNFIPYILSVKFLLYELVQTFSEFAIIYVTFHFYTKSAVRKQQNSN
ncbi:MAG: ABZJ_00895 family protein [Campylobacteraceae bacterium]|jgi:hypothetical protein|nr:ABZJ_00895 family protein [Campylobacteraceae bacterium]